MAKYIIVQEPWSPEQAIIFPDSLIHAKVAKTMNVIAAGFVDISVDFSSQNLAETKIRVYGHSESLRVGNRGLIDESIINQSFKSLIYYD